MDLKGSKTVILYGAGSIARETAKILEYNGILNYMVAVTDKGTGYKEFRGKEILNINEIKESKENSFVIVAISKKNYTAVTETLNSLGYQNVFWISL